ncbi:MAG: hypothetical protein H8Z69_02870 [Nanohaloarchaea archaeon]|nr:hypothetical protein [Candidatus Nanohaloarchaea archaeon]
MGAIDFIKNRIVYLAWSIAGSAVPYAFDTEIIGIAASKIDALESLPGVEPINTEELGLKHYLYIIMPILLDREVFKFFGIDLFEGTYINSGTPSLDPMYDRSSGEINRRGRGRSSGEDSDRGLVGKFLSGIFGFIFSTKGMILVIPLMLVGGLLATGYGAYAGVAADQALAGSGPTEVIEDTASTFSEAKQRVMCLFQGPECLRQWRLNNTKRPDANDVGENYGLKIKEFRLGSGSQLDIAFKNKNYKMPLSFRIRNTRHGLKGINARDVEYKIEVVDYEHDTQNPFCETEWVKINGYDVDDDGDDYDLYPGTSAATGYKTLNSLSLENCHMLSPGAGQQKTVNLYLRYDYFSQATLYFDAMSRQYKNSENIEISTKPSETADTPVEAILNVDSPAVFNEETLNSQPLAVRATLTTEESDVEYQVRDYEVTDSEKTCVPGEGNCETTSGIDSNSCALTREGGSNKYELKSEAKKRLIAGSGGGADDAIPGDYWFSEDRPPELFGCLFSLEDVQSINPAGETLTMGIEANYTVKKTESIDSFKVLNSQCRKINCPIIRPVENNLEGVVTSSIGQDQEYWTKRSAMCDGLDAGDGCKVVESYQPSYDNLGAKPTVDQGEIAVRVSSGNPDWFSCEIKNGEVQPEYGNIAGFDENRLESVFNGDMVFDWTQTGWQITRGRAICPKKSEGSSSTCDEDEVKTQSGECVLVPSRGVY